MTGRPQPDSERASPQMQRSRTRQWASHVVIAAGLIWVVVILARDFDQFRQNMRFDSGAWLAYTFAAGLLAMLTAAPVLRLLLEAYSGLKVRPAYAARLLFVAQMLRHLPGRIWGLVYLVRETSRTIPPAAMLRANIDLMLYSMAFNMLAAILLLLAVNAGAAIAAAFGSCGLLLITASLRFDWPGRVGGRLVARLPGRFASWSDGIAAQATLPWGRVFAIAALFLVAWGLYISIWWALAQSFEFLRGSNIWLLCASYSLAWILGYLAMITPGGLGVREAGFVLIATPLASSSSLAFLALFVRVWQLLLEIVLFLAFAFVRPDITPDNMRPESSTA